MTPVAHVLKLDTLVMLAVIRVVVGVNTFVKVY